jgi:hypothetical protein
MSNLSKIGGRTGAAQDQANYIQTIRWGKTGLE